MRVLLLGGTGNLGRRVIPALLAHGHTVFAHVRSTQKLRSLISTELVQRITIIEGDAFDTDSIADALRRYDCDAVVNTAGTRQPLGQEQTLGKIVASVTCAAIIVGKERKTPLRAWIIGGMSSLQYPGTHLQIQDYMPSWLIDHMRGTEQVVKRISTADLRWSLLCVAMMHPVSEEIVRLSSPRGNSLAVAATLPPLWRDHWIRNVPILGNYLNLVPVIASYSTMLEDVADLIAEDLSRKNARFIGDFVGFKDVGDKKSL